MPCKVSWIWRQSDARSGGWSENYYHSSSDPNSVPATDLTAMRIALLNLHGKQTELTGFRIQSIPSNRLSRVVRYDDPFSGTAGGSGGTDSDYLTSSLNVFLIPSVPHRPVGIWMSGIPDEIVQRGLYTRSGLGGWVASFNAYIALLSGSGSPWRVMIVPATTPQFLITSLGPAPLIKAPGCNFATGTVVKVLGVRPATNWQKNYVIDKVDNDSFNIINGPAGPWLTARGSKPKVYAVGPSPQGINNVYVNFATKHDRGRPIGQHSGKKKLAKI